MRYVFKTYEEEDREHDRSFENMLQLTAHLACVELTLDRGQLTLRPWRWLGDDGDIPGVENCVFLVSLNNKPFGLVGISS